MISLTLLSLLAACGEPPGDPADTVNVDSPAKAAVAARAQDSPSGFLDGDPDAAVQVLEFSDFGCPYCGRFARTTLPALRTEFMESGRVAWRYVPISLGFAGGEVMARAALCAAEQQGTAGFWNAHDLLYEGQVAFRGEDAARRIRDRFADAGFAADALETCMDGPAVRATLADNVERARSWYVRGTPTFVINGVPTSGALPVDFFRKMLREAEQAARRGTAEPSTGA